MHSTQTPLYINNNLAILQATQDGRIETIQKMLGEHPELIHVRTSTKNSSLLHIAAERGHEKICNILLESGHYTNPIDKDGKTPYQRAKSSDIKSILVSKHQNLLCKKYFSAGSIKVLPKNYIRTTTEEVLVMNDADFLKFMQALQPYNLLDFHFLSAMTYFCLLYTSPSPRDRG